MTRRIAWQAIATPFFVLVASVANALPERDKEIIQPYPEQVEERHQEPAQMDEAAESTAVDRGLFGGDPEYAETEYDPKAQYEIYGGKRAVERVRPLIEFGQPLYSEGPLNRSYDIIGRKNLVSPQFYVYGDWRLSNAFNDGQVTDGSKERGVVSTRLNLDVDLRLTATERIHALFRPLDHSGKFTRYEFAGNDADKTGIETAFNLNPVTLFFEGDLGAITAGLTDRYTTWDLPFAAGLMPLVYQNGVWMEDAITGAAFTIPSMNSAKLDISNMDITFFGGFDKVSTPALKSGKFFNEDDGRLLGVTTFIETHESYIEAGYGHLFDASGGGFDYNNATVALTRRYFGRLSNSVRLIYNWGQDPNSGRQTADGYVLLIENSFLTHLPSTLVPYANFFYGSDRPQSLARDAGAGGILKNTGLAFETDNLSGFPRLDDTANNTWGGAVGLQYLFALNKQVVVEAATVQVRGPAGDRVAKGDQYALAARYQQNLSNAWILRADAIVADRRNDSNVAGIRVELRRKF